MFRPLSSSKSTSKVRRQGLSNIRTREIVKDTFKNITDVSCISLHSLRAGGATAAANAGIIDKIFKRHGRWLSENAKDRYVKDNFQSLLSVSRSLRITEPSRSDRTIHGAGFFFLSVTATSAVRFFQPMDARLFCPSTVFSFLVVVIVESPLSISIVSQSINKLYGLQ